MSAESATKFIFPHATLTPIIGMPTHTTMELLTKEVYTNACQNSCSLGGGNHGYMGLIMPDTEYSDMQLELDEVEVAFTKPAEPAPTMNADAAKAIKHVIADYNAMEAYIKQQLIAAVERGYLKSIEDKKVSFGKVTAKAILQHLTTKYDIITYEELSENCAKLDADWNINEPIHKLWQHIEDIQDFAKAGKAPIDDATAMQATLMVLKKTGVFNTFIMMWKRTPVAQWTMTDFQEYFDDADKERVTYTAKEAGYHGAKSATNATTTTKVAATTTATEQQPNNKPKPHPSFFECAGKIVYYCHSHGGTTNPQHTSKLCTRKKEGHIDYATWMNMCAGCTDMNISEKNKAAITKKAEEIGNNNSTSVTNST
jgi:hypothetical protein